MKNADMPAMPPNAGWRDNELRAKGLTKREEFAKAAMQGLLASGPHDCDEEEIAHDAVLHADALLTELEKRHEP